MTDKHRHSRMQAPRGSVPNWALAAFMAGAVAAALVWRAIA